MLRGYGGHEYVDHDGQDRNNLIRNAFVGAGLVVGGSVGAWALTMPLEDHSRPLDHVLRATRAVSSLTPWQVGNTFAIPEFGSTLASPGYLGFEQQGDEWITRVSGAQLQDASTYQYIRKLTGHSASQLQALGITSGMAGDPQDLASHLEFVRGSRGATGSIFSVVGGERRLLADNMAFMEFGRGASEFGGLFGESGAINRAAHAVFQSMDMWSNQGFDPNKVFTTLAGEGKERHTLRPGVLPVPAVGFHAGGSTLPRALPAFSMERFNRLVQGGAPDALKGVIKRLPGIGLGVTPGTGSAMYMRFGLAAAGLAGAGLAVQEADWLRRKLETPGHTIVSAGMAGAVAGVAHKMGMAPKASFFIGLAAFSGQMILPGFDQGVFPGMVSTVARMEELRGLAINPFSYQRRALEGFAPGSTSWQTGALLGLGAVGLMSARVPGSREYVSDYLLDTIGRKTLGLNILDPTAKRILTPRDLFWKSMGTQHGNAAGNIVDRGKLLYRHFKSNGLKTGLKDFNELWQRSEADYIKNAEKDPFNKGLLEALDEISGRHSKGGWQGWAAMHAEGMWAQAKYGFFGADLSHAATRSAIKAKGFKSPLGSAALVFAGVLGLHQLITGGALGSMETYDDLRAQHEGRQYVAVKKGRWWEGGPTPFSGDETVYYRPHQVALITGRVREKGIWGADEDRRSPLAKFFLKNFTYQLERETYYDRPYPMTSAAFSDVPIIGGILSSTIGRVIKPPRLMHAQEFMRAGEGGIEIADVYDGYRREPGTELGHTGAGRPISPFSLKAQTSDLYRQFSEMEGVTGWARGLATKAFFGDDDLFASQPRMAEAGYMTSARRRFQESYVGGAFFSNELVRRVFPAYNSEIERQNPLRNTMPGWLPDRAQYGDPYGGVWGEALMPGAGYEALRPEVRGLDPSDYPDIHKMEILASTYPYSRELMAVKQRVYQQRSEGRLTKREEAMVDDIDKRLRDKMNILSFDRVHENAVELPGSHITQSLWFGAQKMLRKGVAPAEYLIPFGFRPVQKLMGENRDPIEKYESERMYGSTGAFWEKIYRDSVRPAMYSWFNLMGYKGKPLWRQKADENARQFDQMEFYKWMNLAKEARAQGRLKEANQYETAAAGTRMGVNPQGDPMAIYWSLPDEDRRFFNSFANAKGRERKRILSMVPEDQKHLYEAVWGRLDRGEDLYPQGVDAPDMQYMNSQFYSMDTSPMPPADWIGFNEHVDLQDIRVRYVQEQGKDLHDYGLWESQVKKSYNQPFLDGSTQVLHDNRGMRSAISRNVDRMTSHDGGNASQVHVMPSSMGSSTMYLQYDDNRDFDIQSALRQHFGAY